MRNFSIFQIAIIGFSFFIIVLGIIVFATTKADQELKIGTVTMWGVEDSEVVMDLVSDINERNHGSISVNYVQFEIDKLKEELLEALAIGEGPDILLIPAGEIREQSNKILTLPFDSYPERLFKDTFTEAGESLLTEDGVRAVPFSIDPMVMYWNRTTFRNASITTAPIYWDQVRAIVPLLTEKDPEFNIYKSAIAMGEFRNIKNAKGILSTLMLQAGTPIVERKNGGYVSALSERYGYKIKPAEAALSYFSQFANPVQESYTWNRSLKDAQDMFVSGDLAMYLGFASEYQTIKERNPNLNFDIAQMPKSREGTIDIYAEMNVLAIVKQSKNINLAYDAIMKLTDKESTKALERITFLPPLRRDLLSLKPTDDIMSVFYDSSIRSKTVLEYNPKETEAIYQSMLESFVSGRANIQTAVERANAELNNLNQ